MQSRRRCRWRDNSGARRPRAWRVHRTRMTLLGVGCSRGSRSWSRSHAVDAGCAAKGSRCRVIGHGVVSTQTRRSHCAPSVIDAPDQAAKQSAMAITRVRAGSAVQASHPVVKGEDHLRGDRSAQVQPLKVEPEEARHMRGVALGAVEHEHVRFDLDDTVTGSRSRAQAPVR